MEPQEQENQKSDPTVYDIYQALRSGGSADQVLEKYPGLTREDRAAVEAYFSSWRNRLFAKKVFKNTSMA